MGINDHTTNQLIYNYNSFLLKEQDNHKEKYKEFEGWFSASTAGSCFRKQYFNVNGYEGTPPDEKSLRLMRLGTLVHKDIADAFESYREDIESKPGVELFVERQVKLEEYNIVGHLDLAISVNYYLQVATYAAALADEYNINTEDISLSLTWYKKDDSSIRAQSIDYNWIEEAMQYWRELNMALADDKEPTVGDNNTPIYDWECKYCPYHKTHCEGI